MGTQLLKIRLVHGQITVDVVCVIYFVCFSHTPGIYFRTYPKIHNSKPLSSNLMLSLLGN